MQLFVVPRSIPSTFAIIFFSTFFRPPWATQDLSKDRAKRPEIAQNPNFQGKYAVTHDTPATLIVTICRILSAYLCLPSIVRLASPQRCSPTRNGRFARPCNHSAYTYTPSGRSPARLVSFSWAPPRCRRRSKPRSASSGTGLTAHAFVSRFGEKRGSSRALHPPSAARYFVGGIPPPCLARVRWRITRTGVLPFPCACSSHMRR